MSELNLKSDKQAVNGAEPKVGELFKDCVYGICLNVKDHILATHRELALLRRCSDYLRDNPGRVVHIVAEEKKKHTNFIINTLLHLGVSCGQIDVAKGADVKGLPEGICLYVANQ
jgi:hypothetical protein